MLDLLTEVTLADWLLAVFTGLLAVTTIGLWRATRDATRTAKEAHLVANRSILYGKWEVRQQLDGQLHAVFTVNDSRRLPMQIDATYVGVERADRGVPGRCLALRRTPRWVPSQDDQSIVIDEGAPLHLDVEVPTLFEASVNYRDLATNEKHQLDVLAMCRLDRTGRAIITPYGQFHDRYDPERYEDDTEYPAEKRGTWIGDTPPPGS